MSSSRYRIRLLATLVAVGITSLFVVSCTDDAEWRVAASEVESRVDAAFYRVPDPLPAGEPGDLIRSEVILGAPEGARAWRILYHSRDLHDEDIAVSGVVLAPDADTIDPDAGRTVVSWGHPTTGAAQKCAPSLQTDPYELIEGATLLLDAGFVIAATDYPGMGAAGPDAYLIGTTEGRSVLDAARAARQIRDAGAGSELLLWGHSQGGQAALFAAQEVESYAPELDLRGVAVAAPAVELGPLLHDDQDEQAGVTLGAYAFNAYVSVYGPTTPGLALDDILSPAGVAAVPDLIDECLIGGAKELHRIAEPLIGRFMKVDPSTVEPWKTLLEENTAGAEAIDVPMFVAQGGADKLVDPATTANYVQHLCDTGEHVQARVYPRLNHGYIALRALPAVLTFFDEVVHDKVPPSTC